MASAKDVIDALSALHDKQARKIAREPTGVRPGFSALLGAAVTEDGRLRYVKQGGGALVLDAVAVATGTQTVTGSPYRVDYGSVLYDPLSQVTTGASWVFTAAAGGTYIVLARACLNISGGVDWVDADRADLTLQGDVNKVILTWVGMGIIAEPSTIPLQGFVAVNINAGDTLFVQVEQDSGTNRTIDTTQATIVIGHV